MIESRFATYYKNHPERHVLSKAHNEKIKFTAIPELSAKIDSNFEKKLRSDKYAYLEQCVELKIEVALMYINRTHSNLQYI
ncbi:hypothetical protein [Acetobacterium tundrae]|uniref:Uncharacterized protein n=1 Tax=Acetobacterium tundrae TaxID=132932 RepID=A0ABR6WHC3_9FIRM|nr:hypothetical protein [Acetobacterium tundrae]MBC3795856.1 hypothetical protein [Acetobacterium tundrae]